MLLSCKCALRWIFEDLLFSLDAIYIDFKRCKEVTASVKVENDV